jgi:hypothetical protein
MRFWSYVYFKLMKRYKDKDAETQKLYAFVPFCFLVVFIFLPIAFLAHAFFGFNALWIIEGQNSSENRLIRIPLVISPVFLIIYSIYRLNKEKVFSYWNEFENFSDEEKKEKNKTFYIFIGVLICVFLFSVTSTIWHKSPHPLM